MYAVKKHTISCNLTDIQAQITGNIWNWSATTKTDGFILDDGIFDPVEKSQVSKLTISVVKLVAMRKSAESHIFTCQITFGSKNATVSDVQIMTIFNPGKETVV